MNSRAILLRSHRCCSILGCPALGFRKRAGNESSTLFNRLAVMVFDCQIPTQTRTCSGAIGLSLKFACVEEGFWEWANCNGSFLSHCGTAAQWISKCYLHEFLFEQLLQGFFFIFLLPSWKPAFKKNILQSFVCWLSLVQLLSGRQSINKSNLPSFEAEHCCGSQQNRASWTLFGLFRSAFGTFEVGAICKASCLVGTDDFAMTGCLQCTALFPR